MHCRAAVLDKAAVELDMEQCLVQPDTVAAAAAAAEMIVSQEGWV